MEIEQEEQQKKKLLVDKSVLDLNWYVMFSLSKNHTFCLSVWDTILLQKISEDTVVLFIES